MPDTLHFNVSGMSCEGCSSRLEKSLMEIPGVTSVQASHQSGAVEVTLAGKGLSRSVVQAVIEETGFDVVEDPASTRH